MNVFVGFSTTGSLISRLVRWFTKSSVSHSFLMFDVLGSQFVAEAEWYGVRIISLKRFLEEGKQIVKLVSIEVSEEELVEALSYSGVPYDYTALFGSVFPILGRLLKLKWANPWNNSKALICSEYLVEWLQKTGHLGGSIRPADINPDDLLKLLSKD